MLRRAVRWLKDLPRKLSVVREDVQAVCSNDPAARSSLEVMLVYPGLHALWLHRVAHSLWGGGHLLSGRLVSHANRFITGIEIHPGATIGRRVVIDHGMGIVIGETAVVGDGCLLYKGVVLGGTTLKHAKRHPTLGKNVVVGSNACILVIRPVPAEVTVVGVPARVIAPVKHRFDAALDHANLPDPISDMIRALAAQNERLRERLAQIEAHLEIEHDARDNHVHLPYEGDELPPVDGG
jgi:serine O-acetyltransferase